MPVFPIKMPQMGLTMNDGRVVEWLVKVGDAVRPRQAVVTIESEKSQIDVEAEIGGVLKEVCVKADEEAPPGHTLGLIEA